MAAIAVVDLGANQPYTVQGIIGDPTGEDRVCLYMQYLHAGWCVCCIPRVSEVGGCKVSAKQVDGAPIRCGCTVDFLKGRIFQEVWKVKHCVRKGKGGITTFIIRAAGIQGVMCDCLHYIGRLLQSYVCTLNTLCVSADTHLLASWGNLRTAVA